MKELPLRNRLEKISKILQSVTPTILRGYSPSPGADLQRARLLKTKTKSSHRDLVTFFDKAVENEIYEKLNDFFPSEPILGEEDCGSREEAEKRSQKLDAFWLVDPIDGTTNYSRSYPFFCTTMAFVQRDSKGRFQVLTGATWNPISRELFGASRGNGAWIGAQRLRVSKVKKPEQSLLSTGFAYQRTQKGRKAFNQFETITNLTLGVRRDGSAALDLAFVAAGRLDAYWERGLSPWDLAAGMILVEEAGGLVTHHNNSPLDLFSGEILSSNGFLHKWLQNRLKKSL
jgi:myo-inositol-1(or 4)-monophosphatase